MDEYSLRGYGEMFADRVRFDAYRSALTKAVRPGDTVLDLGAGPCIMGLWACQCGAGRVVAVDAAASLALGREIVQASGLTSRFEFFSDYSTKIQTPIRCNVVVSDLRGVLPLFGHHIPSIVDVRKRWLAEGGALIPQRDSLYVALVGSEPVYDAHFSGWRRDINHWSFEPARRRLSNSTRKVNLESHDLLSPAALWLTLDYRTVTSVNHRGTVRWTLERDGTAHGFVVWFESELFDGVHLSNRPGPDKMIYGQVFFPWPEPVPLCAGDSAEIQLAAHLVNDNYTCSWISRVDRPREPASPPLEFRQSTFQGLALSPELLSRMRLDTPPVLLPQGQATRSALAAMDGRATLQSIAAQLAAELPDQFAGEAEAVAFLCSLYGRYWQ
jgi:protein arginine N-methyltransferase 1